jgi:hypothetical protein
LEQRGNFLLLLEVQGGVGLFEGAVTPEALCSERPVLLHDGAQYMVTAYVAATLA